MGFCKNHKKIQSMRNIRSSETAPNFEHLRVHEFQSETTHTVHHSHYSISLFDGTRTSSIGRSKFDATATTPASSTLGRIRYQTGKSVLFFFSATVCSVSYVHYSYHVCIKLTIDPWKFTFRREIVVESTRLGVES